MAAAAPAAADCQGPTVQVTSSSAARGATIDVVGSGFGDNCYDTGPPPPGEGVLGRPLQDLQVLVVQGDTEQVVAAGDAGADYAFEVSVVVPAALEPGEARVVVRYDPTVFVGEASTTFVVGDAPPAGGAEVVVDFGSADETGDEVTDDEDDGDGASSLAWWIAGAAVVAAAVAGGVALRSTRAR
jgi:hypothetical protein